MKKKPTLSAHYVRKIFNYDPRTGEITWAVRRCGIALGQRAGFHNKDGYLRILIDGSNYSGTKVIWLWMTGKWPIEVDHKSLNNKDNKWSNLREATKSLNCMNRRRKSNNTSGFKGVHLLPSGKWCSRISVAGDRIELGSFTSKIDAAKAYDAAAIKHHGEFARLNFQGPA